MASVLSFSTLSGGVFIEDNGTGERKNDDRCFRFDSKGNAEFAYLVELASGDPSPRFYSHCYNYSDFVIA